MTINSKAISNKPDYRPDLLAKNHTNRNIFLFIAVAVPFVIYTFFTVIEIDNENQKYRTKTNDTTVQKLPHPNKTIKRISVITIQFLNVQTLMVQLCIKTHALLAANHKQSRYIKFLVFKHISP